MTDSESVLEEEILGALSASTAGRLRRTNRSSSSPNTYIIPNMFARVVTNVLSPKDAIRWAETEIRKIVDKT